MTGIVGVNRDPMGTGLGANLLVNVWGYCLGSPFTDPKDVPEGLLHPRRLRDGVHKGVIDGGNQSGIPYGLGWECFDDRYIGKPLVYCGTLGTLPKKINGRNGWEKQIEPGDLIVMTGGRIGKDGIHGATFSSEELHKDSPVQAVQIGDPITQKRMGDFIYEARDKNLYRFVTDNGAGGLSSSVGEMASICGGCVMDLKKAPLKYAGMKPWEILISEAQERMSFAVPPEKIDEFMKLAADRDVEATILGKFTDDGKFRMMYGDKTVACLDIKFMHEGLPRLRLNAKWKAPKFAEPDLKGRDVEKDLLGLLAKLNICSCEYKARQYDHEVKGLSVVKPFVGRERDVQGDASVFMVEPLGREGAVLSYGILPRYSDIDCYHMMASVIDLAIRRAVAVGARVDMISGLDNFCWPDPVQSEKTPDGEYKMAQLVRANKVLYDYTCAFNVPCISGKEGSGAVFFSGCTLKCVFCQNYELSHQEVGKRVSLERLAEIFFELEAQGANNINLVTPDHYIPLIAQAMERSRVQGLKIPFVINCSGYETTELIRRLDGLADIYLDDFKYMDSAKVYALRTWLKEQWRIINTLNLCRNLIVQTCHTKHCRHDVRR